MSKYGRTTQLIHDSNPMSRIVRPNGCPTVRDVHVFKIYELSAFRRTFLTNCSVSS